MGQRPDKLDQPFCAFLREAGHGHVQLGGDDDPDDAGQRHPARAAADVVQPLGVERRLDEKLRRAIPIRRFGLRKGTMCSAPTVAASASIAIR